MGSGLPIRTEHHSQIATMSQPFNYLPFQRSIWCRRRDHDEKQTFVSIHTLLTQQVNNTMAYSIVSIHAGKVSCNCNGLQA